MLAKVSTVGNPTETALPSLLMQRTRHNENAAFSTDAGKAALSLPVRRAQKKGDVPKDIPLKRQSRKDYMVLPEAARCILISTFSVRPE